MHARITLFAFAVVLLALASLIPTLQFPSSADVSTFIGPRVWPLALLIALFGLGSALLLMTWRDVRRGITYGDEPEANATTQRNVAVLQRFTLASTRHWWLIAATLIYTWLISLVGFLLASLAFTLVGTLLLGARSWRTILITVAI
ncbi:MAG: tripartite tricarboxylate transporter TctB family protein [Halomonas sp.]|uniref:tripartite tricarboxylate transporter TctB family protein n=2 Tax=unclassified Halomonas TaxID=2609666 RepID=UPI003F9362E0